ncbi:hypothetical protein MARA_00690 (plasmid) [Mycolicibacterium arabiense]|uniref:Uncharacterized protein n=1 Tax=Mycolicibacterium arabiense TaxID=1286181 RepID=A0A7I7RRM0_9MYCO|nr:hypothetical protein [Mycolicibacterium arabiense]MCV7372031.1 hypothetical protein [Mycolicibacterium arabiense]BBY46639.1 hypothetical protein MARA_00690 [Mycolicibacterium arabiense]
MNIVTQIALVLAGCFVAHLLLLAVVLLRTGNTDGLAAVGAAVSAFVTAIVALVKRWPTDSSPASPRTTERDDGGSCGGR